MKIIGKWLGWFKALMPLPDALIGGLAGHPVDSHWQASRGGGLNRPVHPYEPPRLLVIGSVHSLTTGSSSSGKKDANSQYYW